MNIDVIAECAMNNHLQIQDAELGIESLVTLITRTKQLTAHDRMQGYLLMGEMTYKRLRTAADIDKLCQYPCDPLNDGSKGTLFNMKIHTNSRIPEGMMFATMVEGNLCIVAVGMGMY